MKRDLTVVRIGTDSSGRPIFMTRYMQQVWEAILAHKDVRPFASKVVIVQGAFMSRAGGGAAASAGYHDLAGSLDTRTWNLTTGEIDTLVRVARLHGMAFWRRDQTALRGGMDPHAHGTMGTDAPLTSGAKNSWDGYVRGTNGLANGRPDYEWRPKPLVLTPPIHIFKEDFMATPVAERKLDKILEELQAARKDLNEYRANEVQRDKDAARKARQSKKELVSSLGGVMDALVEISNKIDSPTVDVKALKAEANRVFERLRVVLVEDPDVDGPEKPADKRSG